MRNIEPSCAWRSVATTPPISGCESPWSICPRFDKDLLKSSIALPLSRANALNAHVDFPLFQRLALPITQRNTRIAGIKIHDTRMLCLMETIMHAGTWLGGWSSALLHKNIVSAYELPAYTINQLRYDLRRMKAHGLVERDGKHYHYLLTEKGVEVSAIFVLFHKRVCGPLANSLFQHRPDTLHIIDSTLEKAYHRADASIEKIVALLAA